MSKSKKLTIVLAVVLAAVIALSVGIWFATRPTADKNNGSKTDSSLENGNVQTPASGKNITFTIVYKDSSREEIKITTEEKFLAKALEEKGIITYDASGLYTTFNGATADYNVDGGWWCIYEGENMANMGLNQIEIVDGGSYEAVYTIGFAS